MFFSCNHYGMKLWTLNSDSHCGQLNIKWIQVFIVNEKFFKDLGLWGEKITDKNNKKKMFVCNNKETKQQAVNQTIWH